MRLDQIFPFVQFMLMYNKNYTDEQTFFSRFKIFADNLQFIHDTNKLNTTYQLGLNQFSDLTQDEFTDYSLGAIRSNTRQCGSYKASGATPPASIDWREKGIITPVKDQGQCGSCWAFAATEVLESVYGKKTGDVEILSPQELVDCESTSFGCSGGYPENALLYVIDHGLEKETEYPYTAADGQCKEHDTNVKAASCFEVPPFNEDILKDAVAQSPVVVLIEADQRTFQFYKSGILPASSCGTNLDHAVQLVGYGVDNDRPYWIVRNSWGSSWGEDGYIRLERGAAIASGGTCGLLIGPLGLA